MNSIIWIKNRRYYKYEQYTNHTDAHKMARTLKQQKKVSYFILKTEKGLWFPEPSWILYTTKELRIA